MVNSLKHREFLNKLRLKDAIELDALFGARAKLAFDICKDCELSKEDIEEPLNEEYPFSIESLYKSYKKTAAAKVQPFGRDLDIKELFSRIAVT